VNSEEPREVQPFQVLPQDGQRSLITMRVDLSVDVSCGMPHQNLPYILN
jgi:hypothetical protein